MTNEIIHNYHADVLQSFHNYKKLAERAMEQINDEEFFAIIDAESNSVAVIVKHIAGNSLSRWRDFLMTDGEKPDRDRDSEFALEYENREELMVLWEKGWQILFDNLEPLKAADFSRTITIRGQSHTIVEAINRQLTHYAYHVGQIVFLAKHLKATDWETLSVPRNRSSEFNRFLADRKDDDATAHDRFASSNAFIESENKKAGRS